MLFLRGFIFIRCNLQASRTEKKNLVCKLHHTLYRLKQAPSAWYERLSLTLLQLDFQLNVKFSLKHLGQLDYFLGIEVKHLSNGSVLLTKSKCLRDLLSCANMKNVNNIPSPMMVDPHMYRSIAGALQYATLTCPKIT
ncbi:putative mitochondrial protein, partial [Mucuna pruriens]